MTTAQGSLQGHVGVGWGCQTCAGHLSSLGYSHAAVQGVAWQRPQHSQGWRRSVPELGVLATLLIRFLISHPFIGKMSLSTDRQALYSLSSGTHS